MKVWFKMVFADSVVDVMLKSNSKSTLSAEIKINMLPRDRKLCPLVFCGWWDVEIQEMNVLLGEIKLHPLR